MAGRLGPPSGFHTGEDRTARGINFPRFADKGDSTPPSPRPTGRRRGVGHLSAAALLVPRPAAAHHNRRPWRSRRRRRPATPSNCSPSGANTHRRVGIEQPARPSVPEPATALPASGRRRPRTRWRSRRLELRGTAGHRGDGWGADGPRTTGTAGAESGQLSPTGDARSQDLGHPRACRPPIPEASWSPQSTDTAAIPRRTLNTILGGMLTASRRRSAFRTTRPAAPLT